MPKSVWKKNDLHLKHSHSFKQKNQELYLLISADSSEAGAFRESELPQLVTLDVQDQLRWFRRLRQPTFYL